MCTGVVKNVINYYTDKGSHVFAYFIDLTKAFDRVNYWKLLKQLLSDGVDVYLVYRRRRAHNDALKQK